MGKYSAKKSRSPWIPVAAIGALLAVCLVMLFLLPKGKESEQTDAIDTTDAREVEATETAASASTEPVSTVQTEPEATVLPNLADMASQNPDMVGWIQIEGTKIDYPLMYTPQEPEKYLHKDFSGNFSVGGLPFIDAECSLDPVSDNLLIYGHNMQNGTMFRALMSYDQVNFWREHPTVQISTLYEEKTYEILAALYDRVYFKAEEHFKFYQFIDAGDAESFDAAISYFKENALYDTGVTASYGDKLVTLVTCAYHVDNGRFLVVAREVKDT